MSTVRLPFVLQRVNRCVFCDREMVVPGLAYEENPFCQECLKQRQLISAGDTTAIQWEAAGIYMRRVRRAPKKPS